MNARFIAKFNAIDCLWLETFAYKPSVITVTESWLKDSSMNQFFMNYWRYTIFRRDRSHKSGVGILMYMKNDVEVIQHIKPSFNNSEYQIIRCQFQRTFTWWKDLINDISQNIMVINEDFRNNYILVITGDANRLDLSTFTEIFS